jgi:DNA relaxase NicK
LQTEEIPHDVSRYDSAVDLVMSDGQFARRHSALVRLAGGIGKPIRPIGTVERGRTLELNAHVKTAISSPHKRLPEAQVMFYEKGKQLGADPAWKRVELRLRPGKPEAKLAAAALEPSAVWGVFQWTRDVLGCATQGMTSADPAEYPRFRVALPEVEAELRRIRAMKGLEQMAHQYGRTVETLVEFMGEDEAWELIRKRFRGERPEQTPAEAYADLWAPLPTGGKVH